MLRMKPIVLVTFRANENDRKIIEEELSKLADVKYLLDMNQNYLRRISDRVRAILTGSGRDLKEDLIKELINLEMIQTLSAGLDHVPFHIIPDHVIVASNAGGNARAVAEHALALLLSAVKRIPQHTEKMRKGIWERRKYGVLLKDKVVGIIGLGHIGREFAKMAKALGMRVYGINRSGQTDVDVDFIGTLRDLDRVLRQADFILIALPLTRETKGLIGENEFRLMKRNVILVNVGRGDVIDQKALYEFLRTNPGAIAALDVWWRYPKRDEPTFQDYPFHKLENVIMTPHIAGFSPEIRENVIRNAVENIARFLRGEKPRNIAKKEDYIQ